MGRTVFHVKQEMALLRPCDHGHYYCHLCRWDAGLPEEYRELSDPDRDVFHVKQANKDIR